MTRTPTSIGIVTPRYAPAIGGVERHVEMIARGLVCRGFAVEVITTDPSGLLPVTEQRDGVTVRRFPTVANDAVFFVAPQLGWWLLRNAHRYELLHTHSYHTPLAFQAATAARRAQVPLVVTPHYHGTGHSPFRTLIHRPYRPIGAWLLHQARMVICVSAFEQKLLGQHFGPGVRARVIPNGVDRKYLVSPKACSAQGSQRHVLSVGRLDHYKQADRIAKALPFLPRSYSVSILGDGPARSEIQQLVAHTNQRLKLPGQVSEDALLAAYHQADVFVTMSRQESFGMTVLEAAASGAPVVLSDIPAHREVAGYVGQDRVTFVDVDCSPMELAHAIEKATATGRVSTIEHWPIPTWDRAVDTLIEVYATAGIEARPEAWRRS